MATTAGPSTIATDPPTTIAELLHRLGDLPPERVRFQPVPGTATEEDLLHVLDHEHITCELVEGVLVEKAMGFEASVIAAWIVTLLNNFVRPRRLGIVAGADGTLKPLPGLVRAPDASFVSRDRLLDGTWREQPIPELGPDLAVEVLSKGNTKAEIERKLREYFEAGSRLVWIVDPKTRTVRVDTGSTEEPSAVLTEDQTLEGGDVLAGFAVPVRDLFASVEI